MLIKDISYLHLHTINQNISVDEALKLMTTLKVNGIPVVNDDNKLVGMVVKADAYRFLTKPGHFVDYPVELIMSKHVITAQHDEDIITVAKRLRNHNIIALPVLENDNVAGLITIENLLDYFLENADSENLY